jgi:hypothetical protein
VAGSAQARRECVKVVDHEGGMCLARRLKRRFDAEVEHCRSRREPAAAPPGQRRRLGHFGHAEQRPVEAACHRL